MATKSKKQPYPVIERKSSTDEEVVEENQQWTCSCLYKCDDCTRLEREGLSKKDYFRTKDDD